MKSVKRWINPAILNMQAYHVPSATGLVKLDAMENPYGWPEELRQEWMTQIKSIEINRYPDPSVTSLRDRFRETLQIPDDTSIMFGNGSDELIQIIALALAQPDRTCMTPEPGFVMYRLISQTVNLRFCGVPLNPDDFSLDRDAILSAIEKHQPAIIFIAYPNNPTGNLFDRKTVLEVIKQAPGLVVVDEAYHAFAGQGFVEHLGEFDNLLVMRTLSKSGLAGLRLGYLLGPKPWLDELDKIRLPYNINSLTQKTVEFILSHYAVLSDQARQICNNRKQLFDQMSAIDGVKVWPSEANFILFRTEDHDAERIFAGLKDRGVLIKKLHGQHPLLQGCLRVTVGTVNENNIFIKNLQQVLGNIY